MFWVMYWANDTVVNGALKLKCRLFHVSDNAVDFADAISMTRLHKYSIPGY